MPLNCKPKKTFPSLNWFCSRDQKVMNTQRAILSYRWEGWKVNKLQDPSKAHKVVMADTSNSSVNLLHSQIFGYHIWHFKIPKHIDQSLLLHVPWVRPVMTKPLRLFPGNLTKLNKCQIWSKKRKPFLFQKKKKLLRTQDSHIDQTSRSEALTLASGPQARNVCI